MKGVHCLYKTILVAMPAAPVATLKKLAWNTSGRQPN